MHYGNSPRVHDSVLQYTSGAPGGRTPAGSLNPEPRGDLFLRSMKLQVPEIPTPMLPRPRLTGLIRDPFPDEATALDSGQRRTSTMLTLIIAPAGYGKTTLMSEWVRHAHDIGVAWLSLDPEDNDIQHFWRYVIAALQNSAPELGREALTLLQTAHTSAVDRALNSLLADLYGARRTIVLMLDDYHLIDNPAIHTSLAALLVHCPACLHVIISSQARSPLPLGRLRLRCNVSEIQAADLRLTEEEGIALLSHDPRLADNQQAITAILRKTEGWVTGVSLFSASLQSHRNLETALIEFDGTHRYLTEYVIESVWRRQSPAIQAFLLHTAILDQLSSPLCEAVTGLRNGHQMLTMLEQANLFLVTLDQRRGLYRYHHLFAQILRGMLEQMDADAIPTLHRRAAGWYLEQQAFGEALQHLLAGRCWFEAADVLEQHGLPMLQNGQVTQLLSRVRQLPQNILRDRPALMEIKARALMLAGEMNALDIWLGTLEADSAPATLQEAAAGIRVVFGTEAVHGRGVCVHENPMWDSLDAFTRSMQHWFRGDTQASHTAATQAIEVGKATGFRSISLLAMGTLAMLHIARGELRAALRVAHDGLALAHTTKAAVLHGAHHPNPAVAPIFLALGVISYERNALEASQECLEQALMLGEQLGREDYVFTMRLYLARTLAARGQRQQAGTLMQIAVRRAREGRIPFWPENDVLAYQAWLWLHIGETALADRWAQMADLRTEDSQTAQQRIDHWVYAEMLLAQGQHDQAVAILSRLIQGNSPTGTRMEPLIKLLVAYASALFAKGQRSAALPVLAHALTLGQPEGYIRPFLDNASIHTHALLDHYHQKIRAEAEIEQYVRQLLAESEAVSSCTFALLHGVTSTVTLSRREREILQLVEGGLSNHEIAHKLVIEANTVKSHLHRIYQRLGATTRYEAVKYAKTLQLL